MSNEEEWWWTLLEWKKNLLLNLQQNTRPRILNLNL